MSASLNELREALKDRFDVQRQIGEGAAWSVFEAMDASGRHVVLKLLRDTFDDTAQKRMLRELGALARLNHPNIVPILESGLAREAVFYSMPFIAGPSLDERLQRATLSLDEAHRVAGEVAAALEYAHKHGVVHRDVAPRHIRFDGDRAVVKEFWIARALSRMMSDRLTATGLVVGTPGYMSPEQISGGKVDERSDVYSLAVLIVRMLTNDVPFHGNTVRDVIVRQFQGVAAEELPKGLNEEVARAVSKALAADPNRRFASARELVEACFEGESDTGQFVAMRMGRSDWARMESRGFGRSAPLPTAASAPPKRRISIPPSVNAPVIVAGALLVVAVGAYFAWQISPQIVYVASIAAVVLGGGAAWYRRWQASPANRAITFAADDEPDVEEVPEGLFAGSLERERLDEPKVMSSEPPLRRAGTTRVLPIDRLRAALRFQYDIQSEVAPGGMAEVYLAKDLRYRGRVVALKVLKGELAASSTSERFLEEIEITARLSHPGILPLLDSGDADGRPFYVMPFVEGKSLRSRIDKESRLSVADAIGITRDVARALEYAHRCQVVHRDIKPENILLHEGQATVMDFGIALALDRSRDRRLTAGLSIGTPEYMSPEQFWETENIDHRSDIYSLGCVFYEMLAGVPPYIGTAMQLSVLHRDRPIPLIRAVRPETPETLEMVLCTCLAKERKNRFETAAGLVAALSMPGAPSAVDLPRHQTTQ